MNATPSPVSGTVRGVVVGLETPVAAAFVEDVCRHIENIISAEALRTKYGLSDDDAWAGLADNEELQRLVGARKEKRIRDGTAAREKAAHLFVVAPAVLGAIMHDTGASNRHRVDAIRELRACAGGEADHKPNEREQFVINISFGKGHTINKTVDLKPIKAEPDEQDKPMKLIEPELKDDDYESEWCGDV
jgi:hypothetical protein